MALLTLRYDLGDGPVEVKTNLYVMVAWERKFQTKASKMSEGLGIEDLAFMAFEASRQQKLVMPAVFDDFLKRVISDIEVVEVAEEVPTQPVATGAS